MLRTASFICFLSLVLHAQVVPQPSGWQLAYSTNFAPGSIGDWTVTGNPTLSGSWSIIKDGTISAFQGTNQASVTLADRAFADFHLSFQLKLTDAGLNVSFRQELSACKQYFLSINKANVGLGGQNQCGPPYLSMNANSALAGGTWHAVDLVAVGGSFTVYEDGVLVLRASDPTPLPIGGLQFSAPANGTVEIAAVQIYGPPALAGAAQLVWTKTGGPPGGIGYDVRIRMDQPNLMYATDAFSGVNISSDNGMTWSASNFGITARSGFSADDIPIFTITIDPNNPSVLWTGTRNARGVYESTDAGQTWVEKTQGVTEQDITFRGITVDPRNSSVIYAAAEVPSLQYAGQNVVGLRFTESQGVVYKSINGGQSWTAVWRGAALARYVLIDPRDSNVIYVSTGFFDVEASNANPQTLQAGGVGILKSTDGGQTWQVQNQANGLTDLYLQSLAMNSASPGTLIAASCEDSAYSHNGQDSGVFITTNGGQTWTKGVIACNTPGCNASPISGGYFAVAFAPGDPNVAYAASPQQFLRSSDSGKTWSVMSGGQQSSYGPPGLLPGTPVALAADPRNSNRVFQNNYSGGNFLSEDGGVTWQLASTGYTGAQVNVVANDPADALRIFAGGMTGLFRSMDAGNTWKGLNAQTAFSSYSFTAMAVDPSQSENVVAGDDSDGTIVRSTDGGLTQQIVFQQPGLYTSSDYNNRHGFQAIVFAPSNPRTVYAGMRLYEEGLDAGLTNKSYGMVKSLDAGVTWAYTNDANMAGQNVNAIAVNPTNESIVYAGTVFSGLFISGDGGQSWMASNRGLPSLDVRALAIDPTNPSTIYAGLENAAVWKSTDAGANWQFAGAGLDPMASIRRIILDPTNPKVLYGADPFTGVYESVDGGSLWVALDLGLTERTALSLAMSSDGSTLWAATFGGGVFRLNVRASGIGNVATVSAASYTSHAPLAANSIAALFGPALATSTQTATSLPLPSQLGGTTVVLTDSSGHDFIAPLFFVSKGQVNCLIPSGVAIGPATVRAMINNQTVAQGEVTIAAIAPALFTANANGSGPPAALLLRVGTDGSQTYTTPYTCGTGACVPAPIDLSAESAGDQFYLLLFGTGIRGYASQAQVAIGNVNAPVTGVAAQGQFVGLDQVNVQLPSTLAGSGAVNLILTVDGQRANIVNLKFQ